jgi:hypothetical protein
MLYSSELGYSVQSGDDDPQSQAEKLGELIAHVQKKVLGFESR